MRSPFDGDYLVTNVFDHSTAVIWDDRSYRQIAFWGEEVAGVAGHRGYDWLMPEGVPLRAVADGEVIRSGQSSEEYCPPLGRLVVNTRVVIRHDRPGGERFITIYSHMSRVDVAEGDRVAAGQGLGLSGNTGCSTDPHLHFQVQYDRRRSARTVAGSVGVVGRQFVDVDPFGWVGEPVDDPWGNSPQGQRSWLLWLDGESPPLQPLVSLANSRRPRAGWGFAE